MAVLYKLVKNHLNKDGKEQYFAKAVPNGECDINQIAKAMSRSASITEGEAIGYLRDLVIYMKERLGMGETVVLDNFGRFKLSIVSDLVEDPSKFNATKNIRGLKCNFIEEGRVKIGCKKQVKVFCDGVKCVEAPINNE